MRSLGEKKITAHTVDMYLKTLNTVLAVKASQQFIKRIVHNDKVISEMEQRFNI